MVDKSLITCKHCGHTWMTKCKTVQVTCSGCGLKTPNPIHNTKKKEVKK